MELIPIYDGPTVLADMLREELGARGVPTVLRAVGPFLGIIGDAARTPYSAVLVSERDWSERRTQVEECLALVQPGRADEEQAELMGDPASA